MRSLPQARIFGFLLCLAACAAAGDDNASCAGPLTHDLRAGQHHDAGAVQVYNTADHLWIGVETRPPWCLNLSHLAVAPHLLDIPQTRRGNPQPGQFPLHTEHHCADSEGFVLPLADLDASAGLSLVIAYHAEVQNTGDGSGETAWAGDTEFPGASWARYIDYQLLGAAFESPAEGAQVAGQTPLAIVVSGAHPDDICAVTVRISGTGEDISLQYAGQSDQDQPRYTGTLDAATLDEGAYLLTAEVSTSKGNGRASTTIEVVHPDIEVTLHAGSDGQSTRFCPSGPSNWVSDLIRVSGDPTTTRVSARARDADGQIGPWRDFAAQSHPQTGQPLWIGRVTLSEAFPNGQVWIDVQVTDSRYQSDWDFEFRLVVGECDTWSQGNQPGSPPSPSEPPGGSTGPGGLPPP